MFLNALRHKIQKRETVNKNPSLGVPGQHSSLPAWWAAMHCESSKLDNSRNTYLTSKTAHWSKVAHHLISVYISLNMVTLAAPWHRALNRRFLCQWAQKGFREPVCWPAFEESILLVHGVILSCTYDLPFWHSLGSKSNILLFQYYDMGPFTYYYLLATLF